MRDSCTSTEPICIHVRWCEWAPTRFLSIFFFLTEWSDHCEDHCLSNLSEPKLFRWCHTLLVAPSRSSYSYFFFYCFSWFAARQIDIPLKCKMLCLPPFSFCFFANWVLVCALSISLRIHQLWDTLPGLQVEDAGQGVLQRCFPSSSFVSNIQS